MSDVLRLIGGGLLAMVACYIGVLIKKRYKQRQVFFKSASDFAKRLKSELTTLKTPMPDAVKSFLKDRKGEFESVLEKWLESAKLLDQTVLEKTLELPLLKSEEKSEVFAFLSPLGKSVLDEQIAHISYFQTVFETRAQECEKDSKRIGNMYFKLCVLLGFALLLILA